MRPLSKTPCTSPPNTRTWLSSFQRSTIIPCAPSCSTCTGSSVLRHPSFRQSFADGCPFSVLHRIQEHHAENFMTARNLGVVFGRMCQLFFAHLLHSSPHDCSYADALSQSCS